MIFKIRVKIVHIFFSLLTLISPTLNSKFIYWRTFHRKLNLENPVTFNEKLMWLKLNKYMKDPLVIQCADKYGVRAYVEGCGGKEILNELIGVFDSVDDINWDSLPNQFVLKWNFGAGMNVICTDKQSMDKEEVFRQLRRWGKSKYWLIYSEMHYKYIERKIICEHLLASEE